MLLASRQVCSAVFAPQPDLGLIVIDEEHEWTYKQHDASPRYHSRAVASELARNTGAVILTGSASPDLASYLRGLRKEVRLETLPQRVRSSNGRGDLLSERDAADPRAEAGERLSTG